jgi:hypothetical protein
MSCEKCTKWFAEVKHKKPPCATCKIPKLLPENQFVYSLISKYLGLLVDSMGGLSSEGIRLVMDIEKITQEDRPLIVRKITAYVLAAMKIKQEKTNG